MNFTINLTDLYLLDEISYIGLLLVLIVLRVFQFSLFSYSYTFPSSASVYVRSMHIIVSHIVLRRGLKSNFPFLFADDFVSLRAPPRASLCAPSWRHPLDVFQASPTSETTIHASSCANFSRHSMYCFCRVLYKSWFERKAKISSDCWRIHSIC